MSTARLGQKPLAQRILFIYIPLAVSLLFVLFPLYWIVSTSFKPESMIMQKPIRYWPSTATFDNYVNAWKNVGFERYFINSFSIAICVAFFVMLMSILVAYPLTRFRFKGKKATVLVLLCTQFIPRSMLLIPLFMIFKLMNLINSPVALVISYVTFGLPFNALLMRGFLSSIPVALEEAAMIDGCSRLQSIWYVILPILVPACVACASFAFIDSWKEFLFAIMFINRPANMTIPVGLNYMIGEYTINYGTLAAGAVIAIIPPMILFSFIQKYLVGGLSAGSVKG